MNKISNMLSLIAGLGAGATVMYFADPDRGHRRRAIAKDKIKSSARSLSRTASKTRRDLANRAYGFWAESKDILKGNPIADDPVVEQRVRSKMGRVVTHPHAIKVDAVDGNVKLTGTILADEISDLLRCVSAVPGVRAVESLLEVPVARKESGSTDVAGFVRQQVIH